MRFYRGSPDLEAVERRLLGTLPAGALVLAFLFFHKIAASVAAPYNWTRLQRTFLLAHGEKLYYPPDGPVVLAMYGPLSALVYWPATWMCSLSSAMHTAALINSALFLLPVLWVCFGIPSGDRRSRLYGIAAFIIFSYFPFTTSSLRSGACVCGGVPPAGQTGAGRFGAVGLVNGGRFLVETGDRAAFFGDLVQSLASGAAP